MKPIKINNLEDLALAIKLSNAQAVRERNNEPPEYRNFTNAEGGLISKLPEEAQSELKRLKTAPNKKGYIVEDRRPLMSASSNNGKDWAEDLGAISATISASI